MRADPGLIESSRLISAPRERVWAAVSDPTALARWWGPKGFTNTFHVFDFRPGGAWKFTMHGPDGAAYTMDKVYTEIVRPERIVLSHFQPGHDFVLTMTFAELGEQTTVVWRMHFADATEAAKVRAFILSANEQNFDKLETYLRQSV